MYIDSHEFFLNIRRNILFFVPLGLSSIKFRYTINKLSTVQIPFKLFQTFFDSHVASPVMVQSPPSLLCHVSHYQSHSILHPSWATDNPNSRSNIVVYRLPQYGWCLSLISTQLPISNTQSSESFIAYRKLCALSI